MTEERPEENLPDREPAEGGDDQVQAPGADKGDEDETRDGRRESGTVRRERPKGDGGKEREGDYDV